MSTPLTFMASAEAMEKAMKCATGLSRFVHSYTKVAQHQALTKNLSMGRSILRIAQHGTQYTAIRDTIAKGANTPVLQLTVLRNVFELAFLCFNNVELFSKWGVLSGNVEWLNAQGTISLVFVYVTACVVDILKLCALDAATLAGGAAEYHRQWRRYCLDFARHLCDALASLSNARWLGVTINDRWIGILGALSGFAATYINWTAAAEAARKKVK